MGLETLLPDEERRVRVELALRIYDLAENLPSVEKADLLALWPYLSQSLGGAFAVMRSLNMSDAIDLSIPIDAICDEMEATLASKIDEDERRKAALRIVTASKGILQAVRAKEIPDRQVHAVLSGIEFGHAEARFAAVTSGIWDVFTQAAHASMVSEQVAYARSKGGKERGAKLSQDAQLWKTEALEIARRIDQPGWSRTKLATEVLFKAKSDLPGIKSIENWLRDEAESPRGPIRSRKKAA